MSIAKKGLIPGGSLHVNNKTAEANVSVVPTGRLVWVTGMWISTHTIVPTALVLRSATGAGKELRIELDTLNTNSDFSPCEPVGPFDGLEYDVETNTANITFSWIEP